MNRYSEWSYTCFSCPIFCDTPDEYVILAFCCVKLTTLLFSFGFNGVFEMSVVICRFLAIKLNTTTHLTLSGCLIASNSHAACQFVGCIKLLKPRILDGSLLTEWMV